MALWHSCKCGAMIPQGVKVCEACAEGQHTGLSRHMEYNRFRRGERSSRFYISPGWRTVREVVLKLYDGIDIYAYYTQRRVVPADMVHHIEELEENWEKRFEIKNLIPLSAGNHGIISALYKRDEATKRATQELLRGLVMEHWKDAGGIEKVLSGFS